MRKLSVSTLVTLDGVIQDPGGFGETAHGGWGNDRARRRDATVPPRRRERHAATDRYPHAGFWRGQPDLRAGGPGLTGMRSAPGICHPGSLPSLTRKQMIHGE